MSQSKQQKKTDRNRLAFQISKFYLMNAQKSIECLQLHASVKIKHLENKRTNCAGYYDKVLFFLSVQFGKPWKIF